MALIKARDDQEKLIKTMEEIRLLTEKAEQMRTQLSGVVEESNNRIQGYEVIFSSSKLDIDVFEEEEEEEEEEEDNGDDNDNVDDGDVDL